MKKNVFVLLVLLTASCIAFGQKWYPVGKGAGNQVRALDSLNGLLDVGGAFDSAGGIPANYIASWNGNTWDSLGNGVNGSDSNRVGIVALANYNGNLYAGGQFTIAGGKPANYIAEWNGTSWSALGSGMNYFGIVYALTVYNGNLIAAGQFVTAGGVLVNDVAAWNGSSWSALGSGMNGYPVYSLVVYNGNLIAGGHFPSAGGTPANHIASWNGTSWSAIDGGMNGDVNSLTIYNGNLIAGGTFDSAGGNPANYIASWNGSSWSALGSGIKYGSTNWVLALTEYNGYLIVGGSFTNASGISANYVAQWNGTSWSAMDNGFNYWCEDFCNYDGMLIAGGIFNIADGQQMGYLAEWGGPAGINEVVSNNGIKVFPNPSNGIFTFEEQGINEKTEIEIYNMLGEEIYSNQFSIPMAIGINSQFLINISSQPAGIYFYRAVSEKGEAIASGKLIVE